MEDEGGARMARFAMREGVCILGRERESDMLQEMPKLTRTGMVVAVAVSLLISVGLLWLERMLVKPAKWPALEDTRLGIAVCADGVVLINRTRETMTDVRVVINDLTNQALRVEALGVGEQAQVEASRSLNITQVVVKVGALDEVRWTAEVNGRDPRSKAQRQKTMAEAMAGR
jgi:hypothetical protein